MSTSFDNPGSEPQEKNKKSPLIFIIPIALLFIGACVFIFILLMNKDKKNKKGTDVVFHNLALDMAVHDALDQPYDKVLNTKDLEKITELRIHRGYSTGIYIENGAASRMINCLVVDLHEIKYLKNLKDLVIENASNDTIYGFDGLKECTELEILDLYYPLDITRGNINTNTPRHGENELMEVIEACTNLKTLNTVDPLPEATAKRIKKINSKLKLKAGINEDSYLAYGYYTKENRARDDFAYNYLGSEISEGHTYSKDSGDDNEISFTYEECYGEDSHYYKCYNFTDKDADYLEDHPEINSLLVWGNIDIKDLSELDSINNLSIYGTVKNGRKLTTAFLDNASYLSDLKNLVHLSIYGSAVDSAEDLIEAIGDLDNLVSLCLDFIENKGTEDDPDYNEDVMSDYKNELNELYSHVKYLYVNKLSKADDLTGLYSLRVQSDEGFTKKLSECSELRSLHIDDTSSFRLKDINELENLRYLSVTSRYSRDYEAGWSKFTGLPSLYYVAVNSSDEFDNLSECENIRILINDMYYSCYYEDSEKIKCDYSDIAELPYLSYLSFGFYRNDKTRDWTVLSKFKGLKDMNKKNVVFDFSQMKYIEEREDNWNDQILPNLK